MTEEERALVRLLREKEAAKVSLRYGSAEQCRQSYERFCKALDEFETVFTSARRARMKTKET